MTPGDMAPENGGVTNGGRSFFAGGQLSGGETSHRVGADFQIWSRPSERVGDGPGVLTSVHE